MASVGTPGLPSTRLSHASSRLPLIRSQRDGKGPNVSKTSRNHFVLFEPWFVSHLLRSHRPNKLLGQVQDQGVRWKDFALNGRRRTGGTDAINLPQIS